MSIVDSLTSKFSSFIGLNTSLPKAKAGGFDINEFKSQISQVGVLPTNLFLVNLYMSPGADWVQSTRSLRFFCMQTDLPGLDLAVQENIIHGIGPVERFPHTAMFGDINLGFIGDAKGLILTFFHKWLNSIVLFDNRKESNNFYRVAYKDSYSCRIEIEVFNPDSDKILIYTLEEAFPYRINQNQMSWADQNSMMNIGVSFYYKTWHTDKLPITQSERSSGLTTVQKLLKLGTIAETVMALKKPQSVGDAINLVNNANIIGGGLSGFF